MPSGHHWTFLHENNLKHTAQIVMEYVNENYIKLFYPAQKYYSNLIEGLWTYLKKNVWNRNLRAEETRSYGQKKK